MVRNSYKSLLVLAVSALTLVSCGKEDVTDLQTEWTKAENDVTTMLNDVKTANADLVAECQAMPASTTDSAAMAAHQATDQALKDNEAALGEIEKTITDAKAKRDEVLQSGKRADVEAAWNDAKTQYDAATAKLAEIKSKNDKIKADMMAAPSMADTTTMAPAGAEGDKKMDGEKTESKMDGEKKMEDKK